MSTISTHLARYLRSDVWWRRRAKYLRRRRHCEQCGAKKLISVHHLDYSTLAGKERDADLQALCITCHARQHPGKRVQCGPFAVIYDPSWEPGPSTAATAAERTRNDTTVQH